MSVALLPIELKRAWDEMNDAGLNAVWGEAQPITSGEILRRPSTAIEDILAPHRLDVGAVPGT